jgi:hypothetical protein
MDVCLVDPLMFLIHHASVSKSRGSARVLRIWRDIVADSWDITESNLLAEESDMFRYFRYSQ